MQDLYTQFNQLLLDHPKLAPVWRKICGRFKKKGQLSGVLKVGEHLDHPSQLLPLLQIFGHDAVQVNTRGQVRLNFDRFWRDIPATTRHQWIKDLHRALAISLPVTPVQVGNVQVGNVQVGSVQVGSVQVGSVQVGKPDQHNSLDEQKAQVLLDRWILEFGKRPEMFEYIENCQRAIVSQIGKEGLEKTQTKWFQLTRATIWVIEGAEALTDNPPMITLSDLGAQFFNNSKALRSGEQHRLFCDLLLAFKAFALPYARVDRSRILKFFNIVQNPSSIKVTLFGPLLYRKQGVVYDWIKRLWQMGECATLSWDNIEGIEKMWLPDDGNIQSLITCENETPFFQMVREQKDAVILYTAGYPNRAVTQLVRLIGKGSEMVKGLHWGDSDFHGLRIALLINQLNPCRLWRCDLPALKRNKDKLIPLDARQKQQGQDFLNENPTFIYAEELEWSIKWGWLEQEAWREDSR